MNPAGTSDDSFDPVLLGKADALIRRNRPDGVSSDAEELPILVEAVDELPELTDSLDWDDTALPLVSRDQSLRGDIPVLLPEPEDMVLETAMDLESDEVEEFDLPESDAARTPVFLGVSQDQLEEQVSRALAHAQAEFELQRVQAIEVARSLALAEGRQAGFEEGRAEGREAGLSEGLESGRAEGREEALAAAGVQQQESLKQVRQEALQAGMMRVSEHIIELDSKIAQALDAWVARELPSIVAGQLDSMVERIRAETSAHMRATLLPQISDHVAALLDSVSDDDAGGEGDQTP